MIHRVNNRVLLLLFLLIFSITFIGSWPWSTQEYTDGDSYVRSGSYDDNNYGTSTSATFTNDAYRAILSVGINDSVMPLNSTILDSKLCVYFTTSGSTDTKTAYPINASWDEATVTWNNRSSTASWVPAGVSYDSSVTGTYTGGTGWGCFNVTDSIKDRQTNGSLKWVWGWMLLNSDTSNHIFRTKEYSGTTYDPYLNITYEDPKPNATMLPVNLTKQKSRTVDFSCNATMVNIDTYANFTWMGLEVYKCNSSNDASCYGPEDWWEVTSETYNETSVDGNETNKTYINYTLTDLEDSWYLYFCSYDMDYENDFSYGTYGLEPYDNYVLIDNSPPAITFVEPTPDNNSYASGSVIINVTVEDKYIGVGNCIIEVNNSATVTNYTMTNYSYGSDGNTSFCNYTLSGLSSGTNYYIRVYANDTLGNMNVTGKTKFTYDSASPLLRITSPTNFSNFSTTTVGINYTASDALSGLSTCWWEDSSEPVELCYQESANVSTSCGGLSTGVYSGSSSSSIVLMNYTKPTGATNNSLWQITYGASASKITTNLSIPSSCWDYNANKLILYIFSTPAVFLAKCYDGTWTDVTSVSGSGNAGGTASSWSLVIDGNTDTGSAYDSESNRWEVHSSSEGTVYEEGMWWINNTGGNTTIPCNTNISSTFDEGTHVIRVYANDTSGNLNTSSVTFRVDTTGPEVSIIYPSNTLLRDEYDYSIPLNVVATDVGVGTLSMYRYSLNSAANVTFTPNTTITGVVGWNNITVFVNDSAGNWGSASTIFNLTFSPKINQTNITNQTSTFLRNGVISSLIGYWKFDKNWTVQEDSSISNINVTPSGAQITTSGKFGSAYILDGIDDYLASDTNFKLNTTKSFAMSMWIKPGVVDCDANNNYRSLVRVSSSLASATSGWDVVWEQNQAPQFDLGNGTHTHRLISGATTTDLWTHYVFMYDWDNNITSIYKNGVWQANKTIVGKLSYGTNNILNIGRGSTSGACPNGNGYMNGTYDEIMYFNRTLSTTEIFYIYNETNPTYPEFSNVTITVNVTDEDTTSANLYYKWFVDSVSVLAGFAQNVMSRIFTARTQEVTVVVNDSQNYTTTQSWNISTNFIVPTIDYISPTPVNNTNLTVNTFTVNLTGTEANINKSLISYNGVNYTATCIGSSTYYCSYNFTGLTDGSFYYQGFINDSVGNVNQTTIRKINIDLTNPVVTIVSPDNWINSTTEDVLYTATDLFLDKCWYSINGGSTNTTLSSCANITTPTWSAGNTTVIVWANDTNGRLGRASLTFNVDTTYPLLTWHSSSDQDNYNYSRLYMFLNSSYTETNINQITMMINTYPNPCGTGGAIILNGNSSSLNQTLGIGKYNVCIKAEDMGGNTNTTTQRTITLDNLAPALNLNNPINTTYSIDDTVFLNLTLSSYSVGEYTGNSFITDIFNTNPNSITTNGIYIWVLDGVGGRVFKYHMNGTYITFWSADGKPSPSPVGITQNGTMIFGLDSNNLYLYDMNGVNIQIGGSSYISTPASSGTDVTTNGTFFWVTDSNSDKVWKMFMNGTSINSFTFLPEGAPNIKAIAVKDDYVWVTDGTTDKAYKYWMNGTYTEDSWTIDSSAANAYGLTTFGSYFWLLDNVNDTIFKYYAEDVLNSFGGVKYYNYSLNDAANTSFNPNVSLSVVPGQNKLVVTAMDYAGNKNTSVVYFYVSQIPEVISTNVSNSTTYFANESNVTFPEQSNVTINVTVTDDTPSASIYYKWFVDGVSVLSGFAQNVFNYLFTSRTTEVEVLINDSDNNTITETFNITLNYQAPTFTAIPANSSLFYGNQSLSVDFNATDEVAFGYFKINDTRFLISQAGLLTNASPMAVGNYAINVTINDSTNNINWSIYTVQVNKSNYYNCAVYFNTTSPITYPATFIARTNCSSAYTLYRNGTSISNNTEIRSGAGYYNITVRRTDTQNYTNVFNSQFFTVSKNSELCQVLFNETSPLTHPKTFKVWANCTSAFTLYRNGTTITNNSEQSLNTGAYNFSMQRTDATNYTNNYNETQFRIIDTTAPYFTTIPANSSLFYGNQSLSVTFVATDASGFGYYKINDTRFSITQGGVLTNASPMAVGNYEINVTINDTSNNIAWTRYKVQVNKSMYYNCGVYFSTTSPITYPSTFVAYTNCSSAYTLYRNGTSISNGTTINSGASAYNISVQRTDTANYTTTFGQQQFIVTPSLEKCKVLFNETSPLNYIKTFKVWHNCTSTTTLSRNGTTITNNSEQSLSIGAYNFSLQRTDTVNYSFNYNESQFRIIDLVSPYFSTIPANASLFYGNQSLNVTFVATDGISFSMYYINDTRFSMMNSTGWLTNATPLAAGNYEINVTINDSSNNINWTRYKVQINKSNYYDCAVYFNTTSPITFADTFVAYTNCSSAYTLYRNGSSITNASVINSGAGYYNITVMRTDTTNYTNTFNSAFFTINKNTEQCKVLYNTTSPVEYPETFLVWANCTSAFVLARNGTTISNNSEQALAVGAYNFSLRRNDTSNYTYFYNESQMIVSPSVDRASPTFTTIPANSSLFYGNQSLLVTFVATDETAFGYYSINDSRFTINQTGFLSNASPMAVGNYAINISINDTTGNTNATTYLVQVNKSNYYDCGVYFNTTSPITYPATFKVYTNCSSAYTLSVNSTSISNGSTINSGATAYNISVQRTDTANYTNTFNQQQFIISKATLTGALTSTKGWTYSYDGVSTIITYTESNTGDSDVTYKVWRNGTDKGSGETVNLAASAYGYILNSSGGNNYSSSVSIHSNTLNIAKNPENCRVLFNTTSPITYPDTFLVYTNCTTAFTLYRNGTSITNNSVQNNGAGYFNFSLQRTDTTNYSDNYNESLFTITKATAQTGLTFNATSPLIYNDLLISTCSVLTGTGSSVLKMNSTTITSGSTLNLGANYYMFNCSLSSSANYTYAENISYFTINKNNENCRVLFNETSPLIYPKTFLAWSNCTTAFTLYRNGSVITNNSEQDLNVSAYNFSMQRTDNSNYSIYYNETQFIVIDSTNPSAVLILPADNNYSSSTSQNFTANVSDEYSLKNATLYVYNQTTDYNISTVNFVEGTLTNTIGIVVTLVDNAYKWFYKVFDTSGNSYTTTNNTLVIDTVYPLISYISSTTPNATWRQTGDIFVNISASDTNKDSILLSWNGVNETFDTTSNDYYWENKTGLSSGTYTFWASITDLVSFVNTTTLRIVYIDLIDPVINILSPLSQNYNYNTSIALNISVSDTNLDKCWWNIDGGTNTTITCNQNYTFNTSEATHTIYAYVNDSSGRQSMDSVTFTINLAPPSIALNYPPEGIWFNYSTNVPFNFTATDTDGISSCQLWTNTTGTWLLNQTKTTIVSGTTYTFNMNLSNQLNSMWNVWCNDSGANGAWGDPIINRTFNVDTIVPLISYELDTQIDNENKTSDFIYVHVDVTESNEDTITFYLYDSSGLVNSSAYTDSRREINWTNLPDEIYHFNVTINDSAINRNQTITRTATIDTSPPSTTVNSPLSQNYPYNDSIIVNLTVTDNLMGVDTCIYSVRNSTDYYFYTNVELINCSNSTISLPSGDEDYIISFVVNDTLNNTDSFDMLFGIRTDAPAVVLNNPSYDQHLSYTNITINFTATDTTGIYDGLSQVDTCRLYGNWTGTWHINQTSDSVTSGVLKNWAAINLSEGVYMYNVWCNDTLGNEDYALLNSTFTIDTTRPNVRITTPNNSAVSTSFTFNYNITDTNRDVCYYNLNSTTGSGWYFTPNQTLSCTATSKSVTVTADTYNLFIWGFDKAGNTNSSWIRLTATAPETEGGSSGGSSTAATNKTWNMTTENGGQIYKFQIPKKGERTRQLIFTNSDPTEVEIAITCADEPCEFITLSQTELTLPIGTTIQTTVDISVLIPKDTEDGQYIANIIATDENNHQEIVTVEMNVVSGVPIVDIFAKFAQSKQIGSTNIKIPYIAIFILVFAIVFALFNYVILRNINLGLGLSIVLGIIAGLVSFMIF